MWMLNWLQQIREALEASQQKMMSSGATFYGGSSLTNCGATRALSEALARGGSGVRGCSVEPELKWTVEAASFWKPQADRTYRLLDPL